MNNNKNYTLYIIALISAVLTVPIAWLAFRILQAGIVVKTALCMLVFIVLFIAILILYKATFKVSVQEIAGADKATELDRIAFTLLEKKKEHSNPQLRRCIDIAIEQLQRFDRRREVMLEISGAEKGTAIANVVDTVEELLTNNMRRLLSSTEIFDDRGIPDVIRQNIAYMEGLLFKTNEIMTDFETLITEASRMGESGDEQDITRLKDVIAAMKSLRTNTDDEIDELEKKYSNKL